MSFHVASTSNRGAVSPPRTSSWALQRFQEASPCVPPTTSRCIKRLRTAAELSAVSRSLVLRQQWCGSCGVRVDATMVMGLRVIVLFTTSSVISISFSMFIIISDTMRCLVVLNNSPLVYFNNNTKGQRILSIEK